ncbi:uncharacterized protein LOC127137155 [Lathyrus oleraceus]|uniref:uncharacterized protein LOC127137155 n=1 Tax=Pisum sativum TaxID=3888 RepID=UPI0021D17A7C|nr:uncharacterized protein LOC127137155 [Pisum sativum]
MLQLCGPDSDGSPVGFVQFFTIDVFIGKQHGIIVVDIRSNTANGMRWRKDKLIMDCERGENYKKKNVIAGSYTIKVKCPFMLRSVSSGSGWKVTVRCEFHNNTLSKDLERDGVLGRLKYHERKFVNDMTKHNMTPRYIVVALKDRDIENLTSVAHIYKARSAYKTSKRGSLTEMQHMFSLIHEDKYIYWIMDSSNVVAHIF